MGLVIGREVTHVKTDTAYVFYGFVRCTHDPRKKLALYASTQPSFLRETGEVLPPGTFWARDRKEFHQSFTFRPVRSDRK